MTVEGIVFILLGWAIAGGSPGPATLAISNAAMSHGRRAGLTMACGVVAGSATWGIAAGLGMSALMLSNVWVFEIIRYAGACYLLFLAFKSARRALSGLPLASTCPCRSGTLFLKGMALHLTNPKAILSWGAVYAIALPSGGAPSLVWSLFAMLIATSTAVFIGYGFLFSMTRVRQTYVSASSWFDGAFAAIFGAASLKLLTTRGL